MILIVSGVSFVSLLVLLARDADDVAFDLGRSHCPHDAVRDRGRLSLFYASSYRGHPTYQ